MKEIDREALKELFVQRIVSEQWPEDMKPLRKLLTFYECAMMEVETKFRVISAERSLAYDANPIESIKCRVKSVEGIIKKLRKKGLDIHVENVEKHIHDVAGVRVITSFRDEIQELVDAFLSQEDITLLTVKDYVSSPKGNGYRSVHLIVEVPIFLMEECRKMKVEVQIRTLAMDVWAGLEHKLRYKKALAPEMMESLEAELLHCANRCREVDDKMTGLYRAIHKEEKK